MKILFCYCFFQDQPRDDKIIAVENMSAHRAKPSRGNSLSMYYMSTFWVYHDRVRRAEYSFIGPSAW